MKHVILFLLLFLIQTTSVFSQIRPLHECTTQGDKLTTAPTAQNFNPPVFNGTLPEVLDQVFDSITALTDLKGANAAMLLPDGSLWKRAHGVAAELPSIEPLTTEHLMGIASVTKSFIAVTLLRLQEQNMLDLDDSIGQFLPAYPNISGAATVRQLLSHRTGFSDYIDENPATLNDLFAHLDSIWSAETLLAHYVLAPNFPLDSDWSYSNTNYLLAGLVIEVVTGKAWYEVVREQVITPLGLTHTIAYPWESTGVQPYSHAFFDLDGDGLVDDFQGNGLPVGGFLSLAGSAGSYSSTTEDLVKFSERIYGGHLLSAASLAQMQTDFVQDGLGHIAGLGTFSLPNSYNLENWGHDGDLVYKTIARYYPTEKMSLSVQQNDNRFHDEDDPTSPTYDAGGIYDALLEAYLQFSLSSSTTEMKESTSLMVSPNPCSDICKISFPENVNLTFPFACTLTDASGRVVLSKTLKNRLDEISVAGLVSGFYILSTGGFTGKIVVE
ncbi:MAG: serine hydrolase [Saprospiraceae bacterium]